MNQINERLGQFIAGREIDRMADPDIRVARSLAALINPVLYPGFSNVIHITQQELAYLVGLSRQRVNESLTILAACGAVALEYGVCIKPTSPANTKRVSKEIGLEYLLIIWLDTTFTNERRQMVVTSLPLSQNAKFRPDIATLIQSGDHIGDGRGRGLRRKPLLGIWERCFGQAISLREISNCP